MTRKSIVERNLKRIKLNQQMDGKRKELKSMVRNANLSVGERLKAQKKLSEMPRNGAKIRIRNRCELTGRAQGYLRFFKMSRIMLRDYAAFGLMPGLRKGSW